jgi:hypothetical protein
MAMPFGNSSMTISFFWPPHFNTEAENGKSLNGEPK